MKKFFHNKSNYIKIGIALVLLSSFLFYSFSGGITGRTKKNGNGCDCHGPTPSSGVLVSISGPSSVAINSVNTFTLTITGGPLSSAGTNIAARTGSLNILDGSLQKLGNELTHTTPKLPAGGTVTFQFQYTAPSSPGTDTLYAAGNSVNLDGGSGGDQWNFAINKPITITSTPTICRDVVTTSGWNIVSIPVNLTNMSKISLFPTAASAAYAYNNGYVVTDTLVNGKGYWLKFNSAEVFNFCGTSPTSQNVPVTNGWNIIGPFPNNIPVSAITTTPSGIISSSFYGYNNGYVVSDTLKIGKGYWIKVNQSGTLNFPTNYLSKNLSSVSKQNLNSKWAKLIIKDNSNNSIQLYLSNEEMDNSAYELPPIPPIGIFDVRFESQKFVENENQVNKILLSTLEYPIEVKLENAGDKIFQIEDNLGGKIINRVIKNNETIIINNSAVNSFIVRPVSQVKNFALEQNFPNPFNPSTTIRYTINQKSFVQIKVYNIAGELITTLVNEEKEVGAHEISFEAQNLPSGIYFVKMSADNFNKTIKIILSK